METKIVKLGINGEGIGYYLDKPVFINGALVNEVVEFEIIKRFPRYYTGKIIKIKKLAKERIKAACHHQRLCDGCSLMCLDYANQIKYKEENFIQTLDKYSRVNHNLINKTVLNDNPINYRNQCKLPFIMEKGKLANAMFRANSNHAVYIDRCLIHEKQLEINRHQVLKVLNNYHYSLYNNSTKRGMRYLILRGIQNQYQLCLVTGNDVISKAVFEDLMKIEGMQSVYQLVQTNAKPKSLTQGDLNFIGGTHNISFVMDSIKVKLSPLAFFQLNTNQAIKMYNLVKNEVEDQTKYLIETYCGIGGMSLLLHDKCDEIVGIEYDSDAIKDAKINAKSNKISNIKFVSGDAGEMLAKYCYKREVDVLIMDPPRSGADEKMLVTILNNRIKKIIYISCNPSTLAKNLKVLRQEYEVQSVTPLDMFSQTPLLESITVLKHK